MASTDIDQSDSVVAGPADDAAAPLPRGAHAPMSIGQAGDGSSGQPERMDGTSQVDADPTETREWLDSLRYVINSRGGDRAAYLLHAIEQEAYRLGVAIPFSATTPYINTIPADRQPPFPGNREIERRIKSIIRWNAMAMVVRANREDKSIGGHISTFASSATLVEVAMNHFIRGRGDDYSGDQVYFQGHASPGIYARAFLEGRLTEKHLENFRRELADGGGLSSYPHPWLMPEFWEFPTVSMGLGPIMAIYQARFNKYLQDRGIKDTSRQHVWCFIGDGETDEPETLGAISLAAREQLDNLVFVINCNLQRLDGPVRGNGKIIQELEGVFRGAGWNVIKVIWGEDWDPLLDKDEEGLLVKRMNEIVDGQYQKYVVMPGGYIREHFFGVDPKLQEMVAHLSDEKLKKLKRGGHDPEKVYAAYAAAMQCHGKPTVIIAKTIKGYGLGVRGDAVPAGAAGRPRRAGAEPAEARAAAADAAAVRLHRLHREERGPRGLHHHRRGHPDGFAAQGQAGRQVHRADRSRRVADVRHGSAVQAVRHLRPHGPALRAGRLRSAPLLPRGQGRPDSRGGHHRGGEHVELHRRGHGLRQPRRADDPDVHLLLDVRFPADR